MKYFVPVCLATLATIGFASVSSGQMGVAAGLYGGWGASSSGGESWRGPDFGMNFSLRFMPRFAGQLFAEYCRYSWSEQNAVLQLKAESEMTDVPVGLHLVSPFSLPEGPFSAYAGVGLSMHLMSTKTTVTMPDTEFATSESRIKYAIGAALGGEFRLSSRVGVFAELKYNYIVTSERIDHTDEWTDNTNAIYILCGVNYRFKQENWEDSGGAGE